VIQRHILPGTTINTDQWRAYGNLGNMGYIHNTVNHTQNFVNPVNGAHTQRIVSSWRHLKKKLLHAGIPRVSLGMHLCEYLWRKENKRVGTDDFLQMVHDISDLFPI